MASCSTHCLHAKDPYGHSGHKFEYKKDSLGQLKLIKIIKSSTVFNCKRFDSSTLIPSLRPKTENKNSEHLANLMKNVKH